MPRALVTNNELIRGAGSFPTSDTLIRGRCLAFGYAQILPN